MCDRSNSPARSRTARCSSRMPPYWTGIIQPPNSISFAPRASWRSRSGVWWTAVSTVSATSGSAGGPGDRARAARRLVPPGRDRLGRAGDQGSLGLERQEVLGLVERDPPDRLELVVVPAQVAAGGIHQEVVDGLVDPGPALDEPVLDRVEGLVDPDVEPGLLADLAEGRLLAGLARVRRALGQGPGHDVAVTPAAANDELRRVPLVPNDDSAGRSGGRGPQPRHGAVAALERRSVPARPERAQCMVIAGRGRPSVGRPGRAARKARQPPRSRARTRPLWRRTTVGRVDAARKEPAARRPSRDSFARVDGWTNRAAGRAAYFAAMLRSMGRNGNASDRRCK